MERRHLPHVTGDLRSHIVTVPEEIWKCSGIVILGRRIKSLVFTTDIAIIRNCNADAVLAVYPFTPQQVISNSIIQASNIPVLCLPAATAPCAFPRTRRPRALQAWW